MDGDHIMAIRRAIAAKREKIIAEAKEWEKTPYLYGGDSDAGIDCSHLVYRVYRETVFGSFPFMDTATLRTSDEFVTVNEPQSGDIVLWDGHVAIVVDPVEGSFIGAQTSTGVAIANYKTNSYWKAKPGLLFRRHVTL
jgi:cell wall-associated NlpC family hydrolase